MIVKNKIVFGYGSVLVSSDSMFRHVGFQHIEPPKEVGSDVTKEDLEGSEILEKVTFEYNEDMIDFIRMLDSVNEVYSVVEYGGYLFDFTNYNKKSVDMVRGAFANSIRGWQLALAC